MDNGIELATAYVSLAVDGSQVDKGVRRSLSGVDAQADKVGQSAGKKMGSGISSGVLGAATKLATPFIAAFGAVKVGQAIGNFIGDSLSEAIEAQKVGAATDAIVKATGGVAKVSAKDVADLSASLSEKIGVDDEAIQSGANLLLTFKNIRNEADGKIFDQAVAASQDLSKAGFGSVESASKTLGKALNDPEKGMTALGKAGITFSKDQKEAIKKMMDSGDILGAQKLILKEVQSQVGGVAEATATTGEKVRVSWDNVKEQIGTALLPMLERLGRWFLEEGLPAIKEFGNWVKDKLWPALKDGWETVRPGLERAQQLLGDVFGDDSTGDMQSFADFLTDTLIPGIATFVNVWLPVMAAGWAGVGKAAEAAGVLFSAQATVVRTVATVIIDAFVAVLNAGADMLEAISVVPGFGWAKDAADKLRGVAEKAREVKDAINGIPKSRTFTLHFTTTGQLRLPNGVKVDMGVWRGEEFERRALGGPVLKGQPYVVGEKRPEVFIPNQNGRIVPRVPDAMAPAATGGIDYFRLADVLTASMQRTPLAVGVGAVTRAVNTANGARMAL